MSIQTAILQTILNKCQQYVNEPHIGPVEVHAILSFIHREANVAMGEALYPTCTWMDADHQECGEGSTVTWCQEHREAKHGVGEECGESTAVATLVYHTGDGDCLACYLSKVKTDEQA